MNQPSNTDVVIIDANILIAICAKEQGKSQTAELAMADYAAKGWSFYAPNVIVSEVLYVLCRKFQDGALTKSDYDDSIVDFTDQLKGISPPPNGEASLAKRAEEIMVAVVRRTVSTSLWPKSWRFGEMPNCLLSTKVSLIKSPSTSPRMPRPSR